MTKKSNKRPDAAAALQALTDYAEAVVPAAAAGVVAEDVAVELVATFSRAMSDDRELVVIGEVAITRGNWRTGEMKHTTRSRLSRP